MAAGYAFGTLYEFDRSRRNKILFRLGMALTLFSFFCEQRISMATRRLAWAAFRRVIGMFSLRLRRQSSCFWMSKNIRPRCSSC